MDYNMCPPEKYNINLEPCNPCKSEPIKIIIENRCCPCCAQHINGGFNCNGIGFLILILIWMKCCR